MKTIYLVSTHSRPKAAGKLCKDWLFNLYVSTHSRPKAAGHQMRRVENHQLVSTHSRPKAAGWAIAAPAALLWFQLTAARRRLALFFLREQAAKTVSTHSRPKAAGPEAPIHNPSNRRFNSQPPEGGWLLCLLQKLIQNRFQLTAARRRLVLTAILPLANNSVSTHSRPKAAGPA